MGRQINFKHSLTFFISSFLYLDISVIFILSTVGKLFFDNFKGINITLVSIVVLVISFLLTAIYSWYQYTLNQLIYKYKIIIAVIPIIIIISNVLLLLYNKRNVANNNLNVERTFKKYDNYIDLSSNYDKLNFKLNNQTNELVRIDYSKKKYSLKTYKPLRYDDIHFPKTSKFFVYELDGAYLFTFVDNENKNYIIKELNNNLYLYNINIDATKLKDDYKYYELKIINDISGYQPLDINGKEFLCIQNVSNFNVFKNYFANFYVLYKAIPLKPIIKETYPNYQSISYTKEYTNITVNNEVHKVYAKINEFFKITLYEK